MRKGNAPAVSRADRLPSTAGGMTRLAYARAKAAGIALDPLFKHGRSDPALAKPQTPVQTEMSCHL